MAAPRGGLLALVVAWPDDRLAGAVADAWQESGRSFRWLDPIGLASVTATIDSGHLIVGGTPVDAILWRLSSASSLGTEYTDADRVFVDAEARAFWLAALHLPTLASTWRPDAGVFFGVSSRRYWRSVLRAVDLPMATLSHGTPGDVWVPHLSLDLRAWPGRSSALHLGAATLQVGELNRAFFAGDAVPANGNPDVRRAVAALNEAGLHCGQVVFTDDRRFISADVIDRLVDVDVIRSLLPSILEMLRCSPSLVTPKT
jgi:hypothetical protein